MILDSQLREYHLWILYAIGVFFATSAATFITHNFMVKGIQLGLSSVQNETFKLVVEPAMITAVRSWPKFLIGMLGMFVSYSYIGDYSIIGSIGFNLHFSFAVALFTVTGAHVAISCGSIFSNLIVLIISFAITLLFRDWPALIIICLGLFVVGALFFGFTAFIPLIKKKCNKSKQYEEYDLDETDDKKADESADFAFVQVPKR